MHRMLRRCATPFVLALAMGACNDDPSGADTARVSLSLTDAPGDVDSVWVQIGEIYLQGGGNNGQTTLLSAADADALGLVELTQLAGTTLDLVDGVEIPAGNYGQLRFVVEGAVLQTEGGDVFTYNAEHPHGAASTGSLNCPSCSQTGIKVLLPGAVADLEAGAHLLVLDFDVSQSFGRSAGNSGSWVMGPVIRAAEVGFSGAVTGSVDVERDTDGTALVTIPECPAGTARDLSAFVPVAVAQNLVDDLGDPLTSSATVDVDGSFAFPFLHPDGYDLGYEGAIDFDGVTLSFEADAPGVVDVQSGGNVTVSYTITSATCT